MNNTALGAENKKEQTINFISEAHEKFYYEKLKEVRYQDVYHKALCYCLGISDDTRRNINSILVLDAGRYGFVKLQYYRLPQGVEDVITFTDSRSMFENLWQEWFDTKLFLLAKDTPMEGMGYSEIFQCLSEQEKRALTDRKAYFAKAAEME